MKKVIAVVIVALAVVNLAACGYCQDAARKLGRGVANVITSPFEIPKTVTDTYYKELGVAESIFLGIPKGIATMIKRLAVGAFEIVTFPFPVPEGYQPVMEPEFMWDRSQ